MKYHKGLGSPDCIFCKIVNRKLSADTVFESDDSVAFLDNRPVFPGHVLLCPRDHYETLLDLPSGLTGPMLSTTQLLARAVERAVKAEGTFIAINNRISQTVPHLHIHIVPRRRGDGLKGFFWPRRHYENDAARISVRDAIAKEVQRLELA